MQYYFNCIFTYNFACIYKCLFPYKITLMEVMICLK